MRRAFVCSLSAAQTRCRDSVDLNMWLNLDDRAKFWAVLSAVSSSHRQKSWQITWSGWNPLNAKIICSPFATIRAAWPE